jgi:beta-phosphoglucomutase-like phosphatase (HAD superfamily)
VRKKKPSPEVYLQALERMRLKPEACLAFEDSANGLAASLAAGVATIVTPSTFTTQERFPGALAVLSDLGEPDRPFRATEGESFGATFVDAALLRRWHHHRYPTPHADVSALG